MSALERVRGLLRRRPQDGIPRELIVATPDDLRYLEKLHDDSVPLPEGAEQALTADNPRLLELREAYTELDLPVLTPSRWHDRAVGEFFDLRWFRGETLIYWHQRELPRISELKYFVWARYVRDRDDVHLLDKLTEDGAFGCWTFSYPGWGTVSRDLLESANELLFLEREIGLTRRPALTVLDVGAGYGRLAHRATEAVAGLTDYCCVDAIPESTFVSEYYLRHRGVTPPARVVPLHRFDAEVQPRSFDVAVNIHSWSECTLDAIEWWVGQLERLEVPRLLVVPNEPTQLLSLEPDGERRDFLPLLERAGYRLAKREPVIDNPAVRELLRIDDHFHLFERFG